MWNKVSVINMFQPKTLKCYAAQVIVDREISINTYDIPEHLQKDINELNHLKHLKNREEELENTDDEYR